MSWPFWSKFFVQSKIGVLSNWSKIQDGGFGVGFPFSAAAASYSTRLNPLQKNVFLQTEKCICPDWKMYLSKLINEFIRNTECTCWKDGGLGVGFAFFLLLLTRPASTRSESLNPEIWFSDFPWNLTKKYFISVGICFTTTPLQYWNNLLKITWWQESFSYSRF